MISAKFGENLLNWIAVRRNRRSSVKFVGAANCVNAAVLAGSD